MGLFDRLFGRKKEASETVESTEINTTEKVNATADFEPNSVEVAQQDLDQELTEPVSEETKSVEQESDKQDSTVLGNTVDLDQVVSNTATQQAEPGEQTSDLSQQELSEETAENTQQALDSDNSADVELVESERQSMADEASDLTEQATVSSEEKPASQDSDLEQLSDSEDKEEKAEPTESKEENLDQVSQSESASDQAPADEPAPQEEVAEEVKTNSQPSQAEHDFMADYYAKRAAIEQAMAEGTFVSPNQETKVQGEQPAAELVETTEEKYNRSLKKTRTGFGARLNAFLANFRRVDEEFFEELEEVLILSDVGVSVATQLTEDLRYEARLENAKKPEDLRRVIIEKLIDIYEKDDVYNEAINFQDGLTVMLFVGVNGVGKTTSIGKLAYKYKQEGKKVMLVAADTFRAGAVAQLAEWGRRVDVPVVTGPEKADPASVVFDGMEKAVAEQVDVLLIDTAGRLQNKDNLMAELEKIGRIIKRVVPEAPHETLLALDASTGQNALSQAKEFSKITPLTGLILTKIDGTAKGGVVLAIRQDLDIPVKYIGFGEKIDDIGEFHSEDFMRGLLEDII